MSMETQTGLAVAVAKKAKNKATQKAEKQLRDAGDEEESD